MPTVAVAASDNDFRFAVIDFTNRAGPTVKRVDPNWGGSCRVALNGSRCFVGNGLGGQVGLWDVTVPASPVYRATCPTALSGIGALAIQGDLVVVGEFVNTFKARVVLIDFSNPTSPSPMATVETPLASMPTFDPTKPAPPAITSIAFTGTKQVVAAGSSNPEVVAIDFTNVAMPVVVTYQSGFVAVCMDADASHVAVGDQVGGQIKIFDATTHTVVGGPVQTNLGGVTSLAMAYPTVLAGSVNSLQAVRVVFSGASGGVTPFTPLPGGGFTTAIAGTVGACGMLTGSKVALVDLGPTPPVPLGVADTGLPSVGTLALSTFAGPPLFVDLRWVWAWIWQHIRFLKRPPA